MTSTYDLDHLAALEAAATGGTWAAMTNGTIKMIYGINGERVCKTIDNNAPDAHFIAAARNALPAMIADLKDMREMLRDVEFVPMYGESSPMDWPTCPWCMETESAGHAPDCKLDALKKRLEGK